MYIHWNLPAILCTSRFHWNNNIGVNCYCVDALKNDSTKEMHMGSEKLGDIIKIVSVVVLVCVCEVSFQDCQMHEPSFHFMIRGLTGVYSERYNKHIFDYCTRSFPVICTTSERPIIQYLVRTFITQCCKKQKFWADTVMLLELISKAF